MIVRNVFAKQEAIEFDLQTIAKCGVSQFSEINRVDSINFRYTLSRSSTSHRHSNIFFLKEQIKRKIKENRKNAE